MDRSRAPLHGLRFSLVGPGRVGESLAAWAVAAGAELVATAGREASPAGRETAGRLGVPWRNLEEHTSAGEDLLLVCVADPALEEVAETLAPRPQAAVALHVSGSRPAAALAALGRSGSAIGSLHPLRAFPRPCPEPEAARGVVFAIDGDPPARRLARRLAESWGALAVEVEAADRLLYHYAATLAAGGVATLLAIASSLARELGLPRGVLGGYLQLARSALDEIERSGEAAGSITGPAARGDLATVSAQLSALAEKAPELAPFARELALATCRQLAEKGPAGKGVTAIERYLREDGGEDPDSEPRRG